MKKRLLVTTMAAVSVAAVLAASLIWGPGWIAANRQKPAEADVEAPGPRTVVELSPEKFESMNISCVSAARRELQQVRTVPGQLEYRAVRRVELKAPVDSVVEEVRVKPADSVKQGTRLALLTSPDVGLARAELEKSESDLVIANRALEWAEAITGNLEDLLKFLRDKPRPEAVEQEFDEKLLGNHRHSILPAYSRYRLAERLWESAKTATTALPEKLIRERESAREVSKEEFLSICEQSRFDAIQSREKARQNREYARRLVDVSQQKLRTLLGAFSEVASVDDAASRNGAELSRFYLVAPFEGTVEQRLASDRQRVAEGTLLFSVANTDILEVRANIFEGDWQAVSLSPGKNLKVKVPAVGEDREFDARVDYVGRALDPVTGAVPLVALIDNSRHEFRPRMFAKITIPAGAAQEELVVPAAALRTHEKQDFVFVADKHKPRTFRRVDVTIGKRTPDWVTIAEGLSVDERVVVNGAFLLKNELLLERDED